MFHDIRCSLLLPLQRAYDFDSLILLDIVFSYDGFILFPTYHDDGLIVMCHSENRSCLVSNDSRIKNNNDSKIKAILTKCLSRVMLRLSNTRIYITDEL